MKKKFEIEFSYAASGTITVEAASKDDAEEKFKSMSFDDIVAISGAWQDPDDMDIDYIEEVRNMLWHLNKNEKVRDEIIFDKHDKKAYMGGIRRFEKLPVEKLKELVDLEFIDPDDGHNAAPVTQTILEFMTLYPDYTAMGYVVSVQRDDYRMNVDGVEKDSGTSTAAELEDFKTTFGDADEFTADDDEMYCWFD